MKFKNIIINNSILFSLFILSNNNIFTQSILNPSPLKKILIEHDSFFNKQYKTTPFQITHNQYFFQQY